MDSLLSFCKTGVGAVGSFKSTQCESHESRFIWGKLRTIGQETAFQIALRNCSREVGQKVSIHVI